MASKRNPIGELTTLATADDLDGTTDNTQVLDLTGAAGAIVIQLNSGTAGTAGIDVVEFSRDGGKSYKAATAANIGQGHAGLLLEDGTAAAAASAALNAAGTEPSGAAVFSLGPVDGPFQIRVGRKTTTTNGTTWVTGAPAVVALRLG
jgi:hypothetical protein